MVTGRRLFLSSIAVALAGAGTLFAGQQNQDPVPLLPGEGQPQPAPFPDYGPRPRPNPKAQLKENKKNMKRDADQLVQLAQELKTEVDKTNQTDVLSLPLIRRAEEIEKLARQIRSLARAS